MTVVFYRPSLLVVPLVLVMSAPALAQSRPERPYRGLFGSGLLDAGHSLTVTGSLGGGWDNNVVADALQQDEPTRPGELSRDASGLVGRASGGLNYSLLLPGASVQASAATAAHYYPSLQSAWMRRYYGDVAASAQVSRYISVNGTVSYAPYSLSSMFPFAGDFTGIGPDRPFALDVDFASSLEHYFTYTAGVDYGRQLTRKTRLGFDYQFQRRDETMFSPQYDRHSVGGELTRELGRGLDLRAGYRYSEADYGLFGRKFRNHAIDAGVDYNRSLSFSRRTTLSFGTGTTATSSPDDLAPAETQFRLTGNAELRHELSRTWEASAAYSRNVDMDASWGDLVESDSYTARIGGLLNRRTSASASFRGSVGAVGFGRSDHDFNSYYGSAALSYHLTRHMDATASYGYYSHAFDAGVVLPSDFANNFSRHSVQLSVSVWAPVFQRARRTNASR